MEIFVTGFIPSFQLPDPLGIRTGRSLWIGGFRSGHVSHIHLRLYRHASRSWAGQKVIITVTHKVPCSLHCPFQ